MSVVAYGPRKLKHRLPYDHRSLSNVDFGQWCLDGLSLKNTRCSEFGCVGGIMDNVSEFLIGELCSNFIWVHYIHLCAKIVVNKGMNRSQIPSALGSSVRVASLLSEKKFLESKSIFWLSVAWKGWQTVKNINK